MKLRFFKNSLRPFLQTEIFFQTLTASPQILFYGYGLKKLRNVHHIRNRNAFLDFSCHNILRQCQKKSQCFKQKLIKLGKTLKSIERNFVVS